MGIINTYILSSEPSQIVDRNEYVNFIIDKLENSENSEIIMISSKTAVGKSSLVTKTLNKTKCIHKTIRVRTSPINDTNTIDEWSYFSLIFNECYSIFKDNKNLSLYSYINSFKNNRNNKMIISYIMDRIFLSSNKNEFINTALYLIASWILKVGKFDINTLIDDNSISARRIKYQYVKYILLNEKVIIAIDNLQNCDTQSFMDIINLVNETKNNSPKFIFEFTINEKKTEDDCRKMCESLFTTSINVHKMSLEKLDKRYIVDAVSKHLTTAIKDWSFNIKLQKKYEDNNTGNIREMLDFAINYQDNLLDIKYVSNNATFVNLAQLSEEPKLVLSFIINNKGRINKHILNMIINNIRLEVDNSINILKSKLLVSETENEYVLSHASLMDVWNNNSDEFSYFDNLAYNELTNIYKEMLTTLDKNTKLYDYCWTNIIDLYSKFEPAKLINLFVFLNEDNQKVVSAKNAWKYIEKMVNSTQNQINIYKELYLKFVSFCFESELYNEGFSIIELLIKNVNDTVTINKVILYKAMFLSALDRHEENIIYCLEQEKKCKKNTIQYFNIKLISLASYRSLNKISNCYMIHKELHNNKYLRELREWGFFLRLCEMYLDRNKSPQYLKKSVAFFEKSADYIQAGKSLISYSYILASQGKLKKALNKITLAKSYLNNKRMGNHMFLVNEAAIRLLRGDYSENVWELLSQSEITATVPFDRLAIIANKLVWCIENSNSNRHSLLIEQAKQLITLEPDKHIHGIIYYNIYYLLKLLDDSKYHEYLAKACSVKNCCKPIKARLEKRPTSETKFALSKPWHVCFLAFWTYDLD